MRVKLAIVTAVLILAMAVGLVFYVIAVDNRSLASIARPLGIIGLIGLIGSAAAIGVATGARAWVHRTLTVVFVILSFLGAGITVSTWAFTAVGLIALAPLSFDLWPSRGGLGTDPASPKP